MRIRFASLVVLSFYLVGCGGLLSGGSANLVHSSGLPSADDAFASDAVAGQANGQLIAESFPVLNQDQIRSVRWWGRSENNFFTDLQNMETFTVRLYSSSGGLPGTILAEKTVSVADSLPSAIGTASNGSTVYRHRVNFDAPVSIPSGTYWISIGATTTDRNGDGWYWSTTQTNADNTFAAQIPVGNAFQTSGFDDLCFEVERSVISP